MPIPKPHSGESQEDYVSRCIGAIHGEYSKEGQASAVCHSTWDKAKGVHMKNLDVEILAPGKWHGSTGGEVNITSNHLSQMVESFDSLKNLLKVPLKFGHNKEQKMTDGQPAIGWVDKLWVNGDGKLMATFTDLPDIVFNAFEKKLYRNVSIEALFDVTHKGTNYGTVLTAVALLGADMPAVNTLSDLQTYMSAKSDIEFGSRLELSVKNGSIKLEDEDMTELEKAQAEIARLKALSEAQANAINLSAQSETGKDAKIAELTAKLELNEQEAKKVEFTRRKEAVETDLEDLVKKEIITPAKRDSLLAEFTADTADKVEFTIGAFKDLTPASKDKESTTKGKGDRDMKEEGQMPDEIVFVRASELSAKNNVSFNAAVSQVLAADPKLARDYIDQNDQEEVS